MPDDSLKEVTRCTLCGRERPAEQVRWFVPGEGTLVINWPETGSGDPDGIPYCADCLAEQIADESERVIG